MSNFTFLPESKKLENAHLTISLLTCHCRSSLVVITIKHCLQKSRITHIFTKLLPQRRGTITQSLRCLFKCTLVVDFVPQASLGILLEEFTIEFLVYLFDDGA